MSFYKEPPIDVLATERQIKQIAAKMMRGTLSPEEERQQLHQAWRLIASLSPRHEPTAENEAVEKHIEARRAAREERYLARQRAFEQAAEPRASGGIIARVFNAVKQGLGLKL